MMRFFLLFGLLFIDLFAHAEGAYQHNFSVEGDAVILRRANSAHRALAIPSVKKDSRSPHINSETLIHAMSFDPGASMALKVYWDTFATWELRYTSFFDWEETKRIHSESNISLPGAKSDQTKDYTFADAAHAKYTSDLFNVEGNFILHVTPRFIDAFSFSWQVGMRYFEIDETLRMRFTKEKRTSKYQADVWNYAFGPQGGVSLEYNPYAFLTWGLLAKGGFLLDLAEQKKKIRDNNNTIVIQNSLRSGAYFAYFFQGYPYIEIRVGKAFSFFFNYQVLYVGGIAVADKQGTNPNKNHLNHTGHIIYHGATIGGGLNF